MTPCILWTKYVMPSGYGQCTWKQRKWLAHRLVMAQLHGEDAIEGKFVIHTCDVRACINPDHLVIGDHAMNMADMVAKGRAQHWNAYKTHCPQGHAYEGRNVMVYDGRRHCRTCNRERSLARYHATVKKGKK